jgi:superfamily II DNA or RNA helicase
MLIWIKNTECKLILGGPDYMMYPKVFDNIREYLSVEVPGAYFASKHTKWGWNGKRYFVTPKGRMATGFLPVLLKYMDEYFPDLPISFQDERILPEFNKAPDKLGDWILTDKYEHQKQAVEAINNFIHFRGQDIYFPRGVEDLATNAGKTTVIAGLYSSFKEDVNMLVLIHSKLVFNQLHEALSKVYGEVGKINDKNYDVKPLTVAMVQTLYNRLKDINVQKDLLSFNVLCCDESQHSGSKTYKDVIQKCSNAGVRLFVSGTAYDSKDVVGKMTMVGLSGLRLKHISKREMMDMNLSTLAKVHIHLNKTLLSKPAITYDEIQKQCIFYSMERLKTMWEIIQQSEGPRLIAVKFIHHAEFIYNNLVELDKEGKYLIDIIHGQDKYQMEKYAAWKNGEIDVIISTSVLKEGLNMPKTAHIIYAAGAASIVDVKQWMGRIERLDESRDYAYFHDFYDIGRWILKHSEERLRAYKAEKLDITMHFDLAEAKKLRLGLAR